MSGFETGPARLLPRYRGAWLRFGCEAGFTLLELLVVLAIIGLLGALIGPRLFERLEGSKVVTAQTQVRMLKTSLDTMRLDIGRYPTGSLGYSITATDMEGNTVKWEPLREFRSWPTVIAGTVEYVKQPPQ